MRCKEKTSKNHQCKRNSLSNSKYCWQHKKGGKKSGKKGSGKKGSVKKVRSYRARDAKGWKAPKRGNQRTNMATKCGAENCFLVPDKLKFPVCPHTGSKGAFSCKPSCKGALSAKMRAKILAKTHPGLYPNVESKADKILREMECLSILD